MLAIIVRDELVLLRLDELIALGGHSRGSSVVGNLNLDVFLYEAVLEASLQSFDEPET